MRLSTIIVNYNVEHFLEQCLYSVRRVKFAIIICQKRQISPLSHVEIAIKTDRAPPESKSANLPSRWCHSCPSPSLHKRTFFHAKMVT